MTHHLKKEGIEKEQIQNYKYKKIRILAMGEFRIFLLFRHSFSQSLTLRDFKNSQSLTLYEKSTAAPQKRGLPCALTIYPDGGKTKNESLFMLLLFNSMDECTYLSSVILGLACPNTSLSDFNSKPASTHLVAKVWRSV